MNKVLEVIAWSLEDAIKIEEAGADRIELVVDLERGGLTPPIELVKEITEAIKIPVRVMVRNTDDSFVYDEEIHKSHLNYINQLRETKAEGIVFGSIKNGEIDFNQLSEIIKVKGNLKLTFHRAFDTLDIKSAKEGFIKLNNYDVDTILTSGLKDSGALFGIEFISWMVENSVNIEILAGKSIGINNYKEIMDSSGVNSIHVGYSVRDKKGNIDIDKVKELKEGIDNG